MPHSPVRMWFIIGIMIIVGALTTSIVFVVQQQSVKNKPEPANTPNADTATSWNHYQSPDNRLTFFYPKDWSVEERTFTEPLVVLPGPNAYVIQSNGVQTPNGSVHYTMIITSYRNDGKKGCSGWLTESLESDLQDPYYRNINGAREYLTIRNQLLQKTNISGKEVCRLTDLNASENYEERYMIALGNRAYFVTFPIASSVMPPIPDAEKNNALAQAVLASMQTSDE